MKKRIITKNNATIIEQDYYFPLLYFLSFRRKLEKKKMPVKKANHVLHFLYTSGCTSVHHPAT